MTKQLFERVYHLRLECEAVWHDFHALGAEERRICWEERRGPFDTEEQAETEWKKFHDQVIATGEYETATRLAGDIKIEAQDWCNNWQTYYPSTFMFRREIVPDYVKAQSEQKSF